MFDFVLMTGAALEIRSTYFSFKSRHRGLLLRCRKCEVLSESNKLETNACFIGTGRRGDWSLSFSPLSDLNIWINWDTAMTQPWSKFAVKLKIGHKDRARSIFCVKS